MSHSVVDLTADVIIVRRLRAAASLPKVFAFGLAGAALLPLVLDLRNWILWVSLTGCAGLLALLARAIEHGAVWAAALLAVLVSAFSAILIAVVADERDRVSILEFFGMLAMAVVMSGIFGFLAWGGLKAARHRSKSPAWIVTETRSGRRWLARDDRVRTALATFTTAVVIYVGGAFVAVLVAAATRITWLGALAYLPIARLAGRVWTRARRKLALRIQELRKLDARRPVLLLRSFEDDNLPLETRCRVLWFFHAAKEAFTLEEYVTNCVWQLGPVIAIGKPGERLSPLGAAREYVPDHRWRSSIQQYLDESVCVVCILGSTPGLRWEYAEIAPRSRQYPGSSHR